MVGRTFAIGDIHGCCDQLRDLLARLPELDSTDTLLFIGDYVDRGPDSRRVVEEVMALPSRIPAKVVTLRGNHEDAWLHMAGGGWSQCIDDYLHWPTNGCLATFRSYVGGAFPDIEEPVSVEELRTMQAARFFPPAHLEWFRSLLDWYEDEHAIYVHAGLVRGPGGFLSPPEAPSFEMSPGGPLISPVLWRPDRSFYEEYSGKLVVFGHTPVGRLPQLSPRQHNDPYTVWMRDCCIGLDTGAGRAGVLSAVELPTRRVHQSERSAES
jgi:serine/threonine protein phosphatase 1